MIKTNFISCIIMTALVCGFHENMFAVRSPSFFTKYKGTLLKTAAIGLTALAVYKIFQKYKQNKQEKEFKLQKIQQQQRANNNFPKNTKIQNPLRSEPELKQYNFKKIENLRLVGNPNSLPIWTNEEFDRDGFIVEFDNIKIQDKIYDEIRIVKFNNEFYIYDDNNKFPSLYKKPVGKISEILRKSQQDKQEKLKLQQEIEEDQRQKQKESAELEAAIQQQLPLAKQRFQEWQKYMTISFDLTQKGVIESLVQYAYKNQKPRASLVELMIMLISSYPLNSKNGRRPPAATLPFNTFCRMLSVSDINWLYENMKNALIKQKKSNQNKQRSNKPRIEKDNLTKEIIHCRKTIVDNITQWITSFIARHMELINNNATIIATAFPVDQRSYETYTTSMITELIGKQSIDMEKYYLNLDSLLQKQIEYCVKSASYTEYDKKRFRHFIKSVYFMKNNNHITNFSLQEFANANKSIRDIENLK